MRILIDARYLDGSYSGIGTYSRLLLENLARVDKANEYQVVVQPGFHERINLGPNFELLSYRHQPVSLHSYFRIHDLLEMIQPDVFHSLAPIGPVYYQGRMLVTVHDLQPFVDPNFSGRRPRPVRAAYNLFYRWAYPNTFAKSKWILCDSYSTRDDIARLMPGALPKLIVVPPGLDTARLERPPQSQVDAIRAKFDIRGPYLLYYGSTRPNKNLPALVKAFARLVRQHEESTGDLSLLMVLKRDRFFREVEKAIRQKKVDHRVRILEPMEVAEQQALLAGCEVFCFPTKYEGFGFPPLEAMACGVPVLAGRSGALPEVVGDGALIVDPDDTEDIANGMLRLLQDQELRQGLMERGKVRAAKFDWNETALTVRDIYNLLC